MKRKWRVALTVGSPTTTLTETDGPYLPGGTVTWGVVSHGGRLKGGAVRYGLNVPCPGCRSEGTLCLTRRTITCSKCKRKAVFR